MEVFRLWTDDGPVDFELVESAFDGEVGVLARVKEAVRRVSGMQAGKGRHEGRYYLAKPVWRLGAAAEPDILVVKCG